MNSEHSTDQQVNRSTGQQINRSTDQQIPELFHERRFTRKRSGSALAVEAVMNTVG
jgi:hypothetical protein